MPQRRKGQIVLQQTASDRPPWRDDPFCATLFVLLTIGLAWAPFWLGGNRPMAWGVNAAFFPALVLAFELRTLLGGRPHPVAMSRIAGPAALFCAVLIFALAQSASAPRVLAHPIWGMASEALSQPLTASISVNREETAMATTRLMTAASVFWLALQLTRNAARAYLLLELVAVVIAAYSVYGLVLTTFFAGAIPFFDTPYVTGLVRSTFVNRNSFATFAGLGLVIVVGLTLRLFRSQSPQPMEAPLQRVARLVEAAGWRGWLLLSAGFVTLVALLGAISRGGALATAVGLATLFALLLQRRQRGPAQNAAILLVAAGLAVGFVAFSDLLLERIANGGLGDASRLAVDLIVARSILDNPLLGVGYGTFADVFPLYRDLSIPTSGVWDKAHNTYLEVWSGLGLLFGTALIGSIAWLVGKCVAGALRRRRDSTPPLVAAAVSALVGVHALVDFSIQIEAVCLTYMAVLGAGVAQSESGRRDISDRYAGTI